MKTVALTLDRLTAVVPHRSMLGANRALSLGLISLMLAVDVLWIASSDWRFDWSSAAPGIAVAALMLLGSYLYLRNDRSERIGNLCLDSATLLLFSHVGCLYSYVAVAHGGELHDAAMVAVDSALGFDWMEYTRLFLSDVRLRTLSLIAYGWTLALVALTVVWACLSGRIVRSREFVTSIVLGGFLCISIAWLIPTAGGAGYFLPDDAFYGPYRITVDTRYMQAYFDLRDGIGTSVSLREAKGLIAFPSYHSCMAVLIALAYRGTRMPLALMVTLNLLTLIVVPVEGGHHLVDVFGGVAVALVSFAIARNLSGPGPHRCAAR